MQKSIFLFIISLLPLSYGHGYELSERALFTGEQLWSSYHIDSCQSANRSGFKVCKDRSPSFFQPPSRGAGGWEGKCGQTFGANALYTICQQKVDPDVYFEKYFRDLTPGVRPGTLVKGLNKIFSKNSCLEGTKKWSKKSYRDELDYITAIKSRLIPNYSAKNLITLNRDGLEFKRNPVAALIENPGGNYLHWVMIVDIISRPNSCELIVNHWDNQYKVPCDIFSEWSYNVGKSYPVILKSYTLISL